MFTANMLPLLILRLNPKCIFIIFSGCIIEPHWSTMGIYDHRDLPCHVVFIMTNHHWPLAENTSHLKGLNE